MATLVEVFKLSSGEENTVLLVSYVQNLFVFCPRFSFATFLFQVEIKVKGIR